jgi:2-polyprenyl-3-methyl-5-hydroxy-6-metoxy-1,4-benzoquinol methylase
MIRMQMLSASQSYTAYAMSEFTDQQIIASWHKNAKPWISAIRGDEIDSRILVTNQAILDAIMNHTPASVLDIGCGEGWLVRALTSQGIDVVGMDIVPELIEAARQSGPGRYQVLAYEDLSASSLAMQFDQVVCNFSLLGKQSVEHIFRQVPSLLNRDGMFIVQTLHPEAAGSDQGDQDGWRHGGWQGFNDQFTDPAPWYFRTLASWQALFSDNGFMLPQVSEPLHPMTGRPASIIFVAGLAG